MAAMAAILDLVSVKVAFDYLHCHKFKMADI
jgi:hypothetical protein